MFTDLTEEQRSRLIRLAEMAGITEEEAIENLIKHKKKQFNTKPKIEQELSKHNINLQLRVKEWLQALHESIDSYDLTIMEHFFKKYPDKATLKNISASKEFLVYKHGAWLNHFKKLIDKLLPDIIDRELFQKIYDDLYRTVSAEIVAMFDRRYDVNSMSSFLLALVLEVYPNVTITLNWVHNLKEVVTQLQCDMSEKESHWFFKMYYRYLKSSKDFCYITNIRSVLDNECLNTYSIYTDEDLESAVVDKLICIIDKY